MFERFTERARKVVVLAQEEARHFNRNYIGTEHLLLGLLQEESVAAQALGSLDVTLERVRRQLGDEMELTGQRPEPFWQWLTGRRRADPGHRASFSSHSKKAIEFAMQESLQFGQGYVGPEHIILGLVRESEGLAVRILTDLGVPPDEVRREVLQITGEGPESDPFDSVEKELEGENIAEGQGIYRAPVGSLRTSVRVKGRTRTLLLHLDYATEDEAVRERPKLLSDVAEMLEGRKYRSVKIAVVDSGRLILDRFPGVNEVEVNAVRERFFERRTGSGIVLSATFRR